MTKQSISMWGLTSTRNNTRQSLWTASTKNSERLHRERCEPGIVLCLQKKRTAVQELDNLRKALNEARSRGMSDVVNNKYPNINKVSELQPPKSTDAKVPKICQ